MQTPEFLVMHIEDDDHHAELIRTAIEQSYSRWHIIRFVDAESAIDYLYGQLQSTRRAEYPLPSLVLLDLTLPGMGGLEFVGHLRSQRLTRTIPIVALSATRSQEEIEHAYQVGVSSFIVKPTRLRELAIKIAELNMYWSSTALVPPVHDSASRRSAPVPVEWGRISTTTWPEPIAWFPCWWS